MDAPRERPILFSGPMVNAILADPAIQAPKTMTRRIARLNLSGRVERAGKQWHVDDPDAIKACPYGGIGDRLWVRETWGTGCRPCPRDGWRDGIEYRADCAVIDEDDLLPLRTDCVPGHVDLSEFPSGWRPSIHMPRWACRIVLEITDVRIERLQSITDADAMAEGIIRYTDDLGFGTGYPDSDPHVGDTAVDAFRKLWDSLNVNRAPWASNPHVWVISFRMIEA